MLNEILPERINDLHYEKILESNENNIKSLINNTGTQRSGLSQNTDYHILMYFDALNTNPLSVWYHQPLILRHSYHKRGKLRITGFMKNINES